MQTDDTLFCTKRLATYTGLSPSFFEKGRVYGYGPAYIKLRGSVRYKKTDVDAWLDSQRHTPDAAPDGSRAE